MVTVDPGGNLRFGPEAKPITADRLKEELLTAAARTPNLRMAISADKAAPFGQIIKVMDAAKAAKIKTVNAFTKETGKQ